MKHLLLLILCLTFSIAAQAQGNPSRQLEEPNFYENNQNEQSESIRMAGQYLRKYSRQYYLGLAVSAAGTSLTTIGAMNENNYVILSGSVITIGGVIIQLLSHRNIGKAGQMLERSSISQNLKIQASPSGIGVGLAYQF